ncbi:MAG: UDP-glucose/GDP-mannose dehydrogenase family protein [Nitrospinae bacterium]|nr:UDP-glucose/GDP-mannose dehydrogenase family protein [Nitrospinota bacterium]
MNICVIGLGYVGLTTGAVFSDLGNDVICVDIDKEKVDALKKGIMPIYEPGLKEILFRNIEEGRLSLTTDTEDSVRSSEIIFICVGTPPKDTGETDLSQVEAAAKSIAKGLDQYKVIVNKSTVPVGTGDLVRQIIDKHKLHDVEFDVVSNPEFLREGSAVQDTLQPDRIIIGAPSKNVAMKLLELYASLERPMLITDVHSAEIIKYASNAFLAMKVSFINAIADVCERAEADVTVVAKGMGYDHRIGREFLNAGLGFGGSCFPKDIESLAHTSEKLGYDFRLLKEVLAINLDRVPQLIATMEDALGGLAGKTIGVLGLAFKPNTDDMREAKSIEIITELLARGAELKAYDPQSMENARKALPQIKLCANAYEVAEGADALVLVTEWREFKLLNMEKIRDAMRDPVLFDGRNFYNPEKKARLGFTYFGVGRGVDLAQW